MALPNSPAPSDDSFPPNVSTEILSIDYAIVDGYALDATVLPSASAIPSSTNNNTLLTKGDIAGIVVGSVGALPILCLAIWLFVRYRRHHNHPSSSFRAPARGRNGSRELSTTTLIIEPWIPEDSRARLSVIGPFSVESQPTDEKAPIYSNESSEVEEGYPVERERLKQVAAAREAQEAEALAIDPLPTYEV